MTPQGFAMIAEALRAKSGLSIGPDKLYLLETRLAAILRTRGLRDLDALALALRDGRAPDLERDVVEAMTTNESSFFRDEKPFTHVRSLALPRLHTARPPGAKLRIWSAAASTGQEAYSLAMIIADLRGVLGGRQVEILGTDLAREPLARATEGLYTQFEVQRGLPVQLLLKHFRKEGEMWRLSEAIRGMASFRQWNLLADAAPLGRFDIVFCRNVLIYFDPPTKARVLEAISRQIASDGVLYLGGTETVLGVTDRFVPAPGDRGVYALASAVGAGATAGRVAAR
jgi:chemotaxis protein methyltransferase CheR